MTSIFRFASILLLALPLSVVCQTRSFSVSVTGAGEPMILIPGLECPGAVWDGVAAHFRAGRQVHVVTIAGFGGEPAVPGLRLAAVKEDLIRYIRENHLDHAVIVGHSLGGFLALWIAADAPDLASRIISLDGLPFLPALMNPAATAAEGRKDAERMRALYASMSPAQLEAMSRMALSQMISDAKDVDKVAAWAARSDSAFVAQAVYDLMTTDLRQDVAKIRTPVLLIGAGKALGPEARSMYEMQVARVPNHTVVMAANALHFIMFDDRDFLLRVMDGFLRPAGGSHAQ